MHNMYYKWINEICRRLCDVAVNPHGTGSPNGKNV